MWKDSVVRTGGRLVKTTYEVKGLNLDRFINTVKRRKIPLYDLKKVGQKRLIASVNLSDSKNFFAIAKEMCYNIKKVRNKGVLAPLYSLVKNFGLLLGAVVFVLCALFYNDVIVGFDYSGSGKVYSVEVQKYLSSIGVNKYSRFSSIDLSALEDDILKSNPHLSFASCVKVGNRLHIDLALSADKVGVLDSQVFALYSDVDGVVESIKIYRGTALVQVGQTVKAGDLLVDGYAIIKEQTVKINVLATITVITEKQFEFYSKEDNQEQTALLLAKERLGDRSIVFDKTEKFESDGGYVYKTYIKYRRVLVAG